MQGMGKVARCQLTVAQAAHNRRTIALRWFCKIDISPHFRELLTMIYMA